MANNPYIVGKFASAGALIGTLAILAAGCSAETGNENPSGASSDSNVKVLAELKASDGTEYSFLQTHSGDLALGIGANHKLDLSELLSKTPSFTELYQKLSGKSAPEALRAADQQLAAKGMKAGIEALDPGQADAFNAGNLTAPPSARDGVGSKSQALTQSQFENAYCPSGWDFLYCWSNTGGNPWVQRNSTYLQGAMNATNCNTRFRYRYYDDGNWYTLVDRIASPGSHWYYYQYGSYRSRRFEVLNNDGCGVRFAVFGNL
jgi:hypothetical protein